MSPVKRFVLSAAVLIAFAGIGAGPARGDETACLNAAGEVVFQHGPCPTGDDWVRIVLLSKATCDRRFPGFRERSAAAFGRWQQSRKDAVRRVEQSPEYEKTLERLNAAPAESLVRGSPAEAKEWCDAVLARLDEDASTAR